MVRAARGYPHHPCRPLCRALGIALEPHPQNTVLVLRDGVPHAAIVRDFGGARVLANAPAIALPVPAAARAAEVMRETAIACETVEKLTDKFIYPLLTNLWMGLEETLHAGLPHPDPSPAGSAPVGSASGISDSSGADICTHAAQALDRERVRMQFTCSSASEPTRVTSQSAFSSASSHPLFPQARAGNAPFRSGDRARICAHPQSAARSHGCHRQPLESHVHSGAHPG